MLYSIGLFAFLVSMLANVAPSNRSYKQKHTSHSVTPHQVGQMVVLPLVVQFSVSNRPCSLLSLSHPKGIAPTLLTLRAARTTPITQIPNSKGFVLDQSGQEAPQGTFRALFPFFHYKNKVKKPRAEFPFSPSAELGTPQTRIRMTVIDICPPSEVHVVPGRTHHRYA